MKQILCFLLCCFCIQINAQDNVVHEYLLKGNTEYNTGRFGKAESSYWKALEGNQNSSKSSYNLGNAIYKQDRYEEAAKHYLNAATSSMSPEEQAKAFYNLGNAWQKAGKLEESVNAYKESLMRNPNDADTKHNLSYVLREMQQQKQEQKEESEESEEKESDSQEKSDQQSKSSENSDDKNKPEDEESEDSENKNEEKDDSDQEKNEEEKEEDGESGDEEKEKEDQEIEGDDQEGEDTGGEPQEMSKEEAAELLKIIENEEKRVQQKMMKGDATKIKTDKDW